MALTPAEEAQTRDLIAQQAALLSLAGVEPTILSKLGATKVTLSDLPTASAINDADLLLLRQGVTDKSVTGLTFKGLIPTIADASEAVKGIAELSTQNETDAGTDDLKIVTPLKLTTLLNKKTSSQKIFDIDASVSGNNLTITVNNGVWDFRSTTLTDGTPVTRILSSPVSLVIPNGATLGTINATQSRLIIGLLDNAGTLEPFIINIAGGNQLDETNLITTTTINTGADSNNVAYSTTGRTSKAYRIVGFINITQATAGTWVTAPSTVQGYGGQALAAMSSLGYGQTWQQVTRTSGVTYYNTKNKPIWLRITSTSGAGAQTDTITVNGISFQSVIGINGSAMNLQDIIIPAYASYSHVFIGSGFVAFELS